MISGEITKWSEHKISGQTVLTVGSEELLFLQRLELQSGTTIDSLIKVRIGLRSIPDVKMVVLRGYSVFKTNHGQCFLTLSQNGALHKILVAISDQNCLTIACERLGGYICPHCSVLFIDGTKTKQHVASMHIGPIKCDRCSEYQVDKMHQKIHMKNCFFVCGIEGCSLEHSTLFAANNHVKKYYKSL